MKSIERMIPLRNCPTCRLLDTLESLGPLHPRDALYKRLHLEKTHGVEP